MSVKIRIKPQLRLLLTVLLLTAVTAGMLSCPFSVYAEEAAKEEAEQKDD